MLIFKSLNEIVFSPKPVNSSQDLSNQTFGYLTVLGFAGTVNKRRHWFCKCSCGQICAIATSHLLSGDNKSCGCFRREFAKQQFTKHGKRKTVEYRSYCSAKTRCQNPNGKNYNDYGGRGIEFRFDSFEEFLIEIGNRPSNRHSLDRIDVNGHYEKGNIRWATRGEQGSNKRNNILITANGVTQHIAEWHKITKLPIMTIHNRKKRGWCDSCIVNLSRYKICPHLS
jgi:hypothetical protein